MEKYAFIVETRYPDGSGSTHVIVGTRTECQSKIAALIPFTIGKKTDGARLTVTSARTS